MSVKISVEDRTREIGRKILERVIHRRRGFSHGDLDSRLMEWAMRDPELKTQLFRFVDVLPALQTPEEVVRHLREYLGSPDKGLPIVGQLGINLASSSGLAARATAATVERQIGGMARRFIAGSNIREAAAAVRELRKKGMTFTLDLLGEVAVSEAEALGYQRQYLEVIRGMSAEASGYAPDVDSLGETPRVNVSVKLSSLYSRIEPADPDGSVEALKSRLRPILELARQEGAFIHIDLEHYAIKDLTLRVFREILLEPAFRDSRHYGITIQAYLRDSERDLRGLVDWARERGAPVRVRLVRGAYWDYETVIARQRNWPIPVYTQKPETDINFECLTRLLIENYPHILTAIGSHNARSVAYAMAVAEAEAVDIPVGSVEYQMLYGMAGELKEAVVEMGRRVRVYTPYGELIPGMAYLVRRLLENTSNESFLRQSFSERASVDELLKSPQETPKYTPEARAPEFVNEPERDFSREEHREIMKEALARVRDEFNAHYPLLIGGKLVSTSEEIDSTNPSSPSEVVGRVAWAGEREAQAAIEAANRAFPTWRDTTVDERAKVLFRAADIIRTERDQLAAWEVFETGKAWREADADVCETIDYLNYYASEMLRLGKTRRLGSLPGELNEYLYQPRGVAAVIPPWNFPMAILAGMTSAAIVVGNTAVVKPATQSPVIAAKFVDILVRAGLPGGVVNFVPGPPIEVGEYLVKSPDVDIIAFTGSRAVGARIFRTASEVAPGQDHLKRVIAEMGGKNALVIDSDADLDEAVTGAVASAFGYGGQKCSAASRIIVHDLIYDKFLTRFVEASKSLSVGPVENPGNYFGALVDEKSRDKVQGYIELGKTEARVVLETDVSGLGEGWWVGPTIFSDVPPQARIAQEEIFGPVVAVIRAQNFDQALEIAMGTQYCLTGGVYSRSPRNIEKARRDFRVGNLYINRKTTGAIVGRQPFGGFKMSGIGSKAGGPDYLIQFMEPRTITENTLRRGFAPEQESGDVGL